MGDLVVRGYLGVQRFENRFKTREEPNFLTLAPRDVRPLLSTPQPSTKDFVLLRVIYHGPTI